MWPHKRELANPKKRQQGTHTEWFPFQRRGPYPNRPFSHLGSGMWIELTYAVFSGSFKSCFLKKSRKIDGEVIPWFQTFISIHFLSGRNGVRIYQVPIIRDPWTSLFVCFCFCSFGRTTLCVHFAYVQLHELAALPSYGLIHTCMRLQPAYSRHIWSSIDDSQKAVSMQQ